MIPEPAPSAAHHRAAGDGSAGHGATAGAATSAEHSAFSDAADALQSHREPSQIWGDEREAVSIALHWAASHTAVATDPKTTARSAADLQAEVGDTITEDGIGATRAMALFDEVLLPATRSIEDPMNLAHIPAAPTRAAVAFDTVVSAANVFGGVWEYGAGAIFAENQVLRWLSDLLGWPADSAGVFVAGGTHGNLSALATARDHALRERGRRPEGGWALACASTAHSSIASAARLLDMDLISVPVDDRGHLTGQALAHALESDPRICAVVASAGTTNAGIVDDLASVVEVAHRHGAWVHVDGAYGGAALVAPSARERFTGIEQADSFVVDPHKWLFAPYDCCALLYRDPRPAAAAHSQHAAYLDSIDRGESNPADLAAHLSRRARGLPLWYSLATHGTAAYTAAVEACLATSRAVARAIAETEHLELLLEPELSVVVFRRPGWSPAAYRRWSQRLAKDGTILCVPTAVGGEIALRLAFVNPSTDPQAVIEVLRTTMLVADGS
ncbi:pyridoxal phosphate-dependent decarboxylase family protein [Brachybacterium avium]|uniref:pyridoxal phosphate-dependent decarboxylase family protein n=1 Tax=Brachybacterium avium TaxID=2017485 RepID=UPI001FE383D4|nr:aminotransferase class V-fold PLP-dependent enzyme [Brachybacterium avium]